MTELEQFVRCTSTSLRNMGKFYAESVTHNAVKHYTGLSMAITDVAAAMERATKGEAWIGPNDWQMLEP